MQCHEIFRVLISIMCVCVSLSLFSAHVLHISRSQSQIIFQPRLLLVLGIQKSPKTHEIADPKPQLRHQGHRNPNDKYSPWIRWSKFLSCRPHAFAALQRPRVCLFPVIVGEPANFVDEEKTDEEKTRQGATSSSSSRCMIAVVRMDG